MSAKPKPSPALSAELVEKIHAANITNIARKVQAGKSLSTTEQKQLDNARHSANNQAVDTAREIITSGREVMAAVAEIIQKSKLRKAEKAEIFTRIASIADKCTET